MATNDPFDIRLKQGGNGVLVSERHENDLGTGVGGKKCYLMLEMPPQCAVKVIQ